MMSAGYMDNKRLSGGGYGGNGVDFGIYGGAGQASLNPWVVNVTAQQKDEVFGESGDLYGAQYQPAYDYLWLNNPDHPAWSTDPLPMPSTSLSDELAGESSTANKPELRLVTELPASSIGPLSTPATDDLATFDRPFDSPILPPIHDIDDAVTPGTTPGSARQASLPPVKVSLMALSPDLASTSEPNASRLPTIQEEEPSSTAPQGEGATDESTAQSAEDANPATVTEMGEIGASPSAPIDKDAPDLETADAASGDAPTIDAPSQETDDTTKNELSENSTGTIPKEPTTNMAGDDEDGKADEPANMASKKAKTANTTSDIAEAGPSSTFDNATSTDDSARSTPAATNGSGTYPDGGETITQGQGLEDLPREAGPIPESTEVLHSVVPSVGVTAVPPFTTSVLAGNPYASLVQHPQTNQALFPNPYGYMPYGPPQLLPIPPFMGFNGMSFSVPTHTPFAPHPAPAAKDITSTSSQGKGRGRGSKRNGTSSNETTAATGTSSSRGRGQGGNAGRRSRAPATVAAGPSSTTGRGRGGRSAGASTGNTTSTAGASTFILTFAAETTIVQGNEADTTAPPPQGSVTAGGSQGCIPKFLSPGKVSKNERDRSKYLRGV